MDVLAWLINLIVLVGVAYLAFAMALAGWIAALRAGQAVSLLPEVADRRSNLRRQLALVGAALIFCVALIYFLWIPVAPSIPHSWSVWLTGAGLGVFVLGAGCVLWARRTLGRMWGISTSREVKLAPDHKLVKTGPYALIRHPMYSGWWIAMLGMVCIYRTLILIVLLAFSVVAFARRARLEERVLSERFGSDWHEYAESTRAFFPFLF